jgi:hypothetical protein
MKLTLEKLNLLPPDIQKEFLEAANISNTKTWYRKSTNMISCRLLNVFGLSL